MTLSTLSVVVTRDGTGATDSFSFPFTIQDNTQIEVIHIDADGIETGVNEGTGPTEYSISVASFPGSGSITYPADSSFFITSQEKIRIRRTLDLTQPTRLRIQGGYDPRVQEGVYDRLTMIDQQAQEQIDRAAILPETGFTDLAGASPIVNDTEDGFRWAVGFEGPAGADGAAGPAGPAGPWEFLASHTLSTNQETLPVPGDTDYIAIAYFFLNITTDVDNSAVFVRWEKNGTVKDSNYDFSRTSSRSGSSTPSTISSATSDAHFLIAANNFRLGSAANEDGCGVLTIWNPHGTVVHKARSVMNYTTGSGEASQMESHSAYNSTDATSPITNIEINCDGNLGGTVLVYGLKASGAASISSVTAFKSGSPSSSEVLIRYVFTDDADFDVDYAGSILDADTAATSSTVFDIEVNGSEAGTITVAGAGTTGTFDNFGAGVPISAGDVLTVTAPDSPDATLADISINLRAILDL